MSKRTGAFTRALAAVLCVAMLAGLSVSATGCKFINNITNGFSVSNNYLSETELARLMTNAIISDKNVADCYAKVPNSQLGGLSYSMFSEYCSILRKCSQEHGSVESFRILDDSEKSTYFAMIDSYGNDDCQSVEKYGDMDVIELCYVDDKKPDGSPVRFTISQDGDKYSLAGDYIIDSMLAYSYINHYFEMIDNENIDGIEAIIKSTYASDIYMNSVIHAKADYISEYYKMKVKTSKSDYKLKLIAPTHVTYLIPEVFTEDGDSLISKTVELHMQSDGTFGIIDKVPAMMNEVRLYKNGDSKLRMGSTYTPNELYNLLGNPIFAAYDDNCVILTYNGMTIRLEAEISSNHQWSAGRLISIVLRSDNDFSLGEELYVGMNVSELLLVYPMFDECDFTGTFENGDGEFALTVQFDDYGNVSRIRLGEAVG